MGIIPFSQPAVQKEFFFNKTHIPGDIGDIGKEKSAMPE
jgi:hypothetical protein